MTLWCVEVDVSLGFGVSVEFDVSVGFDFWVGFDFSFFPAAWQRAELPFFFFPCEVAFEVPASTRAAKSLLSTQRLCTLKDASLKPRWNGLQPLPVLFLGIQFHPCLEVKWFGNKLEKQEQRC